MKEIKVFVVGSATGYANFIENKKLVDNINDADIVLFTGGEDVDPSYYGCKKHPTTSYNTKRDKEEKEIFDKIPADKLVVGICRGSQFCCVMNGGLLVQHSTGHGIYGTHEITNQIEVYHITSTHHQMQYPYNLDKNDFTVLFTSLHNLSNRYEGDKINPEYLRAYGEPEIVLYHKQDKPRCLAIQGHPEYMGPCAVVTKINQLINKYLNK